MKSRPSDERRTPRWFFNLCDSIWGPFDLDCFAALWNHQVARYITREQDFYRSKLTAKAAWVQPPYSRGNLFPALETTRARVLSGQYERAVCLHPVDPSADWWKRNVARPEGRVLRMESLWCRFPSPLVEAYQTVGEGLVITLVLPDQRLPFDSPIGGEQDTGAMQPSAVTVFERRRLRVRSAA